MNTGFPFTLVKLINHLSYFIAAYTELDVTTLQMLAGYLLKFHFYCELPPSLHNITKNINKRILRPTNTPTSPMAHSLALTFACSHYLQCSQAAGMSSEPCSARLCNLPTSKLSTSQTTSPYDRADCQPSSKIKACSALSWAWLILLCLLAHIAPL